ncbi:hypothetical protein VP01_282g6 [Puccinia sorghi]|uniref:Uncharacterized protein n=1 Tax=Puccinia sorghi TaxID=27349 RepID=A0A0L6V315_9BASI|nr:hypothetical protein VP01_282g6 [Puccinia sorghi]
MPSLSRLTRSYERAFKNHPALTLAITNGCLKVCTPPATISPLKRITHFVLVSLPPARQCLGDFLAQLLPSFLIPRPNIQIYIYSLPDNLSSWTHTDHFAFLSSASCMVKLVWIFRSMCREMARGLWHFAIDKRRIPLTEPRGTGVVGGSAGGSAATAAEEEELRLIETEKSLTNLRPISMRSRSIASVEHVPTLRFLASSDAQSLPHPKPKIKPNAGFRFWGLVKRILLDQLIMAPLYTFQKQIHIVFISLTGWFEGLTIPEIQERLRRLYWYILTSNWKVIIILSPAFFFMFLVLLTFFFVLAPLLFDYCWQQIWPLIQIFNFSFMPLQSVVIFSWTCAAKDDIPCQSKMKLIDSDFSYTQIPSNLFLLLFLNDRPWQGSCGVLWTVFLSLSTHSSAHLHSSNASDASGATMLGPTLSRIFKARPSKLQTDPAAAGTSGPDHLLAPLDLTTNSSSSSSSDASSSSSQFKRKSNRVIG